MADYLFGPVMSSRLGRSLGIDLLGDRICSFDCLYCESGPTTQKTIVRREYADSGIILAELEKWLNDNQGDKPDHITLGGEGEPCLNLQLGKIIRDIKKIEPDIPLAVLTNSSLLGDPQVRKELRNADVVLPSLDTLVQEEFIRLNRPCAGLDIQEIARGLEAFCKEFSGRVLLEILLVPGINDSRENMEKITVFLKNLDHERVDLSVMSRPGAHMQLKTPDHETLHRWQKALHTPLTGAETGTGPGTRGRAASVSTIMDSIRRRPQTLEQLCSALGTAPEETSAMLDELVQEQKVRALGHRKEKFYTLKEF
ncbi:Radical SAM domain protein [Desulfonatronospira thiodismutans ASO3-1]|uniref:Radical SAM domain protein n=1 Tax=Desulfonatronospira thiodismutans ASO3-1 TaxID=555779 RepID=D6ST97_9BACT|nr:radical SAM protein [Desulfonatronospira thiodismutans]EFI33913.1 Radical SAM domain protein [Desulfonatronospira thiodismutans ASO3-1]